MTADSTPPSAARRPHSFARHGITVEDPWAWLRDPGYPDVKDKDVLSYLEAENAFFEKAMEPHKRLTDALQAKNASAQKATPGRITSKCK